MTSVTDAEIDALVARGWDWHSAYRHLQGAEHAQLARIEVAKPSRQLAGSTVGESRNSSNPSPNTSPYNPHQEEG